MHNFKKVLGVSVLFVCICAAMAIGFIEAYIHSEYHTDQDARERQSLAGTLDCLVLGSSHLQQGIIPSELDRICNVNSYVLADGWQSLYLSQQLLDTELARNPVKRVILGVTYDTLTRTNGSDRIEGDLYAIPRLETVQERLAYVRESLSLRECKDVYISYLQYGADYLMDLLAGKEVNNVDYTAKGFREVEQRNMLIKDDEIVEIYNSRKVNNKWREKNIAQLKDIIQTCKDRNIDITVVVIPMSARMLWNFSGFDTFREQLNDFCEENEVEVYDFNLLKTRYALFDEELSFSNPEHLSIYGAQTFTPVFAETMNDIWEGKDVSDIFYASYKEVKQDSPYMKYMLEHQ